MDCGFKTFVEQITLVPKGDDAISASRVQRTTVIF